MELLSKLTGSGEYVYTYKWRYIQIIAVSLLILILSLRCEIRVDKEENIRYLLSSISQGLASVFALVITISLVLTQFFAKDKEISKKFLEREFRPITILYYIFFIFAIIFPLILLAKDRFEPVYIKLSLGSAVICLYGVIEFALGFKQKIEMLQK
jgi:di/tricarboxylate transporter